MSDAGQVSASAAEVYDEFFLPALFAAWPPRVVAAAALQPGQRVVDVACGTGVLAMEAALATSPGGHIVGVDLNPGMLAVARRKAPKIDWLEAPAEALPFEAESFDAAVSQFGLMFFEDKPAAIAEMWRVVRPRRPSRHRGLGFPRQHAWLLGRHLDPGPPVRRRRGGLAEIALLAWRPEHPSRSPRARRRHRPRGPAHAGRGLLSIRFAAWMHSDVRGWTLANELDDEQYERLVAEAEVELNRFVTADGSVRFAHPALIATAQKS